MQEETPLAPAQIMTSVILEPQYSLHSAADTMGRAACCSLLGVLEAAGIERMESGLGLPAYWIPPGVLSGTCRESCCQLPPQEGPGPYGHG